MSKIVRYVLPVCVLAAVFTINMFQNPMGLGPAGLFDSFEAGSEAYVVRMMEATKAHGLDVTGGFMIAWNGHVYMSNFALQGKVFSLLYRISNMSLDRFLWLSHLSLCVLLGLVLATFVLYVKGEFGVCAAVVLTAGCLCSDWMVFAASNMQCVYVLHLLPFTVSMILFRRVVTGRMPFSRYVVIVGALVMVKSLCYFDYNSNIILSTAIAPVYYGVMRRQRWRTTITRGSVLIIAGGVATVVAIVATCVQSGLMQGSMRGGFQQLFETVCSRMYSTGHVQQAARPGVTVFDILADYMMIPAASVPFTGSRLYLPFMAFVIAILPLSLLPLTEPIEGGWPEDRRRLLALTVACWIGLAATMSWGFLMKGHMFHHRHINGMMFYLPYVLLVYIFVGYGLRFLAAQFREQMSRRRDRESS